MIACAKKIFFTVSSNQSGGRLLRGNNMLSVLDLLTDYHGTFPRGFQQKWKMWLFFSSIFNIKIVQFCQDSWFFKVCLHEKMYRITFSFWGWKKEQQRLAIFQTFKTLSNHEQQQLLRWYVYAWLDNWIDVRTWKRVLEFFQLCVPFYWTCPFVYI